MSKECLPSVSVVDFEPSTMLSPWSKKGFCKETTP